MNRLILCFIATLVFCSSVLAQDTGNPHIEKRYNIFFRINSPKIEENFKDNARTLSQMKSDIETTLELDGAVPDSLLILSTASPDGGYQFNKRLAQRRAASTKKLLLEMFPQFKDAHIKVEYLEEDWDGLLQVLKAHPEMPQREKMIAIINNPTLTLQQKENRIRACKSGWEHLIKHHIYALRNSSITLSVVMTEDNADDEFVRRAPIEKLPEKPWPYTAIMAPMGSIIPVPPQEVQFYKTIFAARTNLLIPGLNIGIEIPMGNHWSIGVDYYYPWAVSSENRWCGEMLGLFVDTKYWITGEKYRWSRDSRLKGHAIGLYAGAGYYDYQKIDRGAQGEYVDFGMDYTFATPIADDKLRLEFNIGVGLIRTWYRPYYPSSDFSDLIKEPGVKYRSTNFVGPTRASVSLVYPITVKTKNPYIRLAEKAERKEERKNQRNGGEE